MAKKKVEEERRIQIFNAIGKCLESKAYYETSTREIAKIAKVNHGMLYYFFKSKDDILLQYIDFLTIQIESDFNNWLLSFNDKKIDKISLFEKIYDYMIKRITLNSQLIKIYMELWSISRNNNEVKNKLQKTYDKWIDKAVKILHEFKNINKKEAKIISQGIVASLEGISLFSVIYDEKKLKIKDLLNWHKKTIISILKENEK